MIQVILKLYVNARINELNDNLTQRYFFQNTKPLWAGAYRNRIDQPEELEWSQFPLKYFELILLILFSITPNGTK